MGRLIVNTLLGLLFCVNAFAQEQFLHFDTQKGLPNNLSEAILRDSYGFLWVGTYEGLSKYDGSRFQNYPITDSINGIKGNVIFSLFEDSRKIVWIGSNKGLYYYNRKLETFSNPIPENCILGITQNKNGILCVSSYSGIYFIDIKTKKIIKTVTVDNGLPSNILTKCVSDKQGNFWVGTQDHGLVRVDVKTYKVTRIVNELGNKKSIPSNRIKTLGFDNAGLLWIGTADAGIGCYNVDKHEYISLVNNQTNGSKPTTSLITSLYIDSKNNIWFILNGCLTRYNKATKAIRYYRTEKYNDRYIQAENVCFITEDTDETIWLGTYGSGIYCLNKQQNYFHIYSTVPEKQNSLRGDIVTSFLELGNELLIGLDYNGLQYFNKNTQTFRDFEHTSLNSTHVLNLTKDDDDIWCSTWGEGIYRINAKTKSLSNFVHQEGDQKTLSINNIKKSTVINKKLWIGTWGDGVELLDKNLSEVIGHEQLTQNSKVFTKPCWVSSILNDSKGRVWFSTMRGVFVKKGNEYKAYFADPKNKDALHDDMIYSLFEDSKHQIWLMTNSGLERFNDKTETFSHFGVDKKLPRGPRAMLEDKNHNLWIGAIDGIYSFNEASGVVRKYSSRNGQLINNINDGAALKTTDGTMFFGGKNGFVCFNPEILKPSFDVPRIVCRNYYLDNEVQKSLDVTDTLSTIYSNAVISIDIVDLKDIVLNFASFEYTFGDSKDWKTVDESKRIIFSNKNPGTYTLTIRATYDNKTFSTKTLTIIIEPLWMMTWWFKCLVILVLGAILYSIYRIRLKVIKTQNEQLTKTVAEKTRELVDANEELLLQNTEIAEKELLLQIRNEELQKNNTTKDKLFTIISEDLKKHFAEIMENSYNLNTAKSAKSEKERQQYVKIIYNSSKQINSKIDLFLNWSKSQSKSIVCNPVSVDVESLIRESISLYYNQILLKEIELQLLFDHHYNALIDNEMMTIVLRNLLSNAVKYTQRKGKITIQTFSTGDHAVVQIIDSGVGMSPEMINNVYTRSILESTSGTEMEQGSGLGLVICRDFLNINKAKFEIKSKLGEGTTVSLYLQKGDSLSNSQDEIVDEQKNVSEEIQTDENATFSQSLLIVEDNEEIMQYIVDIFEPYYTVETAKNAEEGFAKALQNIPDLIITDINMPGKNGIEMCIQIQSETLLTHIPIIILTAFNNINSQVEGLKAGAYDFMVKPFDRSILFLKVQSILESRNKFKDYLKRQFIQQPSSVFSQTPDDKFLMTMHAVLEKNYKDPGFLVEQFSSEMGYSRSQFFRKLKAIIDTTPLEYLKVFRLNRAKEMIETGNWKVSDVAYDVGFNDPHYFSICFKSQFGNSPNYYLPKKD